MDIKPYSVILSVEEGFPCHAIVGSVLRHLSYTCLCSNRRMVVYWFPLGAGGSGMQCWYGLHLQMCDGTENNKNKHYNK